MMLCHIELAEGIIMVSSDYQMLTNKLAMDNHTNNGLTMDRNVMDRQSRTHLMVYQSIVT